jgi:hypothetical protein
MTIVKLSKKPGAVQKEATRDKSGADAWKWASSKSSRARTKHSCHFVGAPESLAIKKVAPTAAVGCILEGS